MTPENIRLAIENVCGLLVCAMLCWLAVRLMGDKQ